MADNDSAQEMGHDVSRRDVLRSASAVGALSLVGSVPSTAASGDLVQKSYSSGFGSRTYYVYEPSWYDGGEDVPMFVCLHGCTQDGQTFADETRMPEIAEEEGFVPIFPETDAHTNDCWHWWDDGHRRRGNGEADEIAGIVDEVKGDYTIDDDRVYLTGFSAGGGMTGDLVAEYADVYAGVATVAGFPYGAADGEMDAQTVMSSGSGNPEELGDEAYDAMEGYNITRLLPTIVIHGSDDFTVDTVNGEEATIQATQTNDLAYNDQDDDAIDDEADNVETGTTGGYDWTRREFEDPNGNVVTVEIIIDGLGHDWPGGATGGSYTAPDAPDGSQIMWDYLSQFSLGGIGEPVASASVDQTAAAPDETLTFDGSDSDGGSSSITSYEWDFSDGSTATGETVEHSFDSDGTYDVTLTITNEDGETDTDLVTVEIDSDPTAAFSVSPDNPIVEDDLTFDGTDSSGGVGSITDYEWDLGDGTTDSGEVITHSYAEEGSYEVTLTVTNDEGKSDSQTAIVDVESGLYCGTATNSEHVDAGRAYNSGGCYYAEGSDEYMGSCISSDLTILKETSTDFFEVVEECEDEDDGGDDDDSGDGDDGGDELYCGTATNGEHVDAGRAYESWGCYYAEGSGEYLGCMSTTTTTLEETAEGYYEEVDSC